MTDYKALYEAEVKRRENAETRWNKSMKVSRDSKERIQELEKQIEKEREEVVRVFAAGVWERRCLKEENEQLKEEVNDRVVIEDIAYAFGSEEGGRFDWESEIAELKEELDGFRKRPAYAAVIWERDCLKEENEKLKESINRL